MSDFTFLTSKQCEGFNRLKIFNVFRKRFKHVGYAGTPSTYFANHFGYFAEKYWTKSFYKKDGKMMVYIIDETDDKNKYWTVHDDCIGVRPVLPFSRIESIPTNDGRKKRAEDGILEVEYGYYPQDLAPGDMQRELTKAYKKGKLTKTGNTYTIDRTYEEFEYKGKRYVRVIGLKWDYERYSGIKAKDASVWFEVQPVEWLIDEEAKLMVSTYILFSGIPFNRDSKVDSLSFEESDIKKFMDKYFARDLLQTVDRGEKIITGKKKNPYKFDYSKVSEEDIIRKAIQSNVAVFLHGKPGCGKSARVRELDPDYIELNLSHLDPELLDGMGGERDGKAVHIKPAWLEELEEKCEAEPDKIHIVFLEELTNATDMMQKKAFGIALDKKVAGKWRLPENARVVAAGNEIEDSILAMELSEPLFGRFAHVYIETDAEKWLKYAMTPNSSYEKLDYRGTKKPEIIHPAIYAFISSRRDKVLRTAYDREHPKPFADPRRWEMASDMLYGTNNPNTLRAIIGEELTREFIEFCMLATITVEDVLGENYKEEEIQRMSSDEKLSIVAALTRVKIEDFEKVREFVKKLGPEICRQFELLWAGGDEERLKKLREIIAREKEKEPKGHREKKTITEKEKNPYNFDYSKVSEENVIIGAIQSNVAVFLHGKPGCGKSARVRELDPDYIELNLSHLDPELLDGMGGERDGKAVHIKPAWLEELEEKCEAEPDKIHIVFLEELTNATDMMQKKAFGIALDKKVAGKWRLPENARVVAAGNEIEDSILAMELSEPLFGRFAHVYIETDAEKWLKYAMTPNSSYEKLDYRGTKKPEIIHPAIYAFISSRRDKVLRTAYDREHPKPFADPRRWEMASDMLYGTNNPNTLRAIIGKELTMEFIKFCTLATITVEDVLEGNYTEEDILEMDLEEKLSTVAGLTRVGIEDFEKVREFVKKLGPEICSQFELLWAGGDEERLKKLQEIIAREKEKESKKHRGEEAEETAESGIVGFNRIEGAYGEYMSREDAKEEKTGDNK